MTIYLTLNLHNIAYKNALGNAIQIVSVLWGLKHLLAYALSNFDVKIW